MVHETHPVLHSLSRKAIGASAYQTLHRMVAAMTRLYEDGAEISWHSHQRGQLLCCGSGYMSAQTMDGTFILPHGYGLIIAPEIPHRVRAHGQVAMRTLYITPEAVAGTLWQPVRVVRISALMQAVIEALTAISSEDGESPRYQHLAALALEELAQAEESPFSLPWPRDKRLQRLCETLTLEPGHPGGIDDWAQQLGMSRRSLTRRCRDELNMSFVEWRRRVRLAHVLKARAEGKGVEQIATEVGYRSPSALRAALRNSLDEVPL